MHPITSSPSVVEEWMVANLVVVAEVAEVEDVDEVEVAGEEAVALQPRQSLP